MSAYSTETFEHRGHTLTMEIHGDPDLGAPEKEFDCYSPEACQAWHSGDWEWIGVVVRFQLGDDPEVYDQASLWGIESDCGEAYLMETARELADELLP